MGPGLVGWLERITPWQMALLLALVAELLFVVHLGQPAKLMFDETHYVPAARDVFGLAARANEEHPPFAKWLIGLSMAIFGDTPVGWRALSTVAGVATMLAIYAVALRFFDDVRTAATAALLVLLNQMLFIQSRIGMLEVFAGAFLFGAVALLVWGQGRPGRRWLAAAGASLGLAAACKWSALPYAAPLGLAVLWTRRDDWLRSALAFGGAAVAAYVATFIPAVFFARDPIKLDQLLAYQLRMFELQTRPLAEHTYQSTPWEWPLITRPIWYLYEPVDGVQRGVLLLGNPAIMWGGLVALASCLWDGWRERQRPLLLLAGLYIFAFGILVLIPKKIGFYYYYYFPGLVLPLLIAATFHHVYRVKERWLPAAFLGVSFALFAYFYPILSAAPLAGPQAFQRWMWLSTWP
jgi:dolichyl-phosphate-mannose--protein O-mannosyl transferase